MTNLKDIIEAKCIEKGWSFVLYNDMPSYNHEVSRLKLTEGINILTMKYVSPYEPQYENGYYNGESRVSALFFFGRKFESTTHSSNSETFNQKYDNRLRELEELVYWLKVRLNCTDNLKSIQSSATEHIINFLSTSLDGITWESTFVFDGQYE